MNTSILKYIDIHMISSIITSVGLILLFLGIFYFSYAAGIEKEIIGININIVTSDLLNIIVPTLSPDQKVSIANSLTYPDMSAQDAETAKNNNVLIGSALTTLGTISIICMIISFIICYFGNLKFFHILGLNLIVLCFVGLTEFSFLHLLPEKFIAADTNYVRYIALTNLKQKLNIS